MPLFLIPLALSIFSAGAGIFSQVQANKKLEEEGQKALADQQAKNTAAQIDQYATYIKTVDALNAEQLNLDLQAARAQAQTSHSIALSLYATAAILFLLTFISLRKTPRL